MAHQFCQVCKPNTRKSCASCPRVMNPPEVEVKGGMSVPQTLSYMGRVYELREVRNDGR